MRVQFDDLKKEFKRILLKKGVSEQMADDVAQMFAETSLDGVYSHGVNRFPRMISYLEKGYIKPEEKPSLVQAMGAFEQWDGNQGFGNTNAKDCMNRAIELAKTNTIGCVALKNTNHWMRGGTFGWQAADAGCIGICWTNTQQNMPPWGSTERRIGNNPLILSVPRQDGHVVVDMAMAQFSYGQLENHKLRGEKLPVVGGYDTNGNITDDPVEIEKTWRVLPIGFWKGSGLSLLLDLIATVLSGGLSSLEVGKLGDDEYKLSQVFIAIDTEKVASSEFLKIAVEDVLNDIKASERVNENEEIKYPGEQTLKKRIENTEKGIPVDDTVWETILSM